jgi:hypothetical protein
MWQLGRYPMTPLNAHARPAEVVFLTEKRQEPKTIRASVGDLRLPYLYFPASHHSAMDITVPRNSKSAGYTTI